METIRFVCVRIAPTIDRNHLLSFPGAAKRAYSSGLYRYLPVSASNSVCRCRLVADAAAPATAQTQFPGFYTQRRHITIAAVLCTDKPPDAQAKSSQSTGEGTQRSAETPQKNVASSLGETPKSGSSRSTAYDLGNDDLKNKSLFIRFKEYFKRYWYVMLPVHLVTSCMFFGGFYYLASLGLSPVPLLEYWGMPEKYVDRMRDSNLGYLAVALAFYKVATPLRYLTTLGVSGVTVRVLAKKGILPSSTQVRKMVQSKVKDIKGKRG